MKEILAGLPFFKHFNDMLLQQLADITTYIKIPVQQNLLTQGELNSNLYILISGRLGVYVGGGRVACLEKRGDIIGEMSVVSRRPTSATIVAESEVELYSIKAEELAKMRGENEDRTQHLLFRIYSQVLAEKLSITNQKAKRFEEMNRSLEAAHEELRQINQDLEAKVNERTADLQQKTNDLIATNQKIEQKNAEVTASHRKLEELYASRRSTFSHLQKLYKDHLVPLRFALDALVDTGDSATRQATNEARTEVAQAIQLLEPITSLYSTELAMRSKRVLLADSNKKHQINTKMALGGTGVQLEIAGSSEEADRKLETGAFDILFVDSGLLEWAGKVVEKHPSTRVVLMTSDYVPSYLPQLLKLQFMPNIVSRSEEDRTFTIKNIVTTVTKLASRDLFGLEKYLAWGTEFRDQQITSSADRQGLIQGMDQYFEGLGIRRTNRERAATVAEELLMNAIYDAPADDSGRHLFNHLPRTVEVQLKPEHRGRFRYATDGVLIAVSVEDPFGSLSGETILKYLESCYGNKAGQYNKEKGGAGRGLHQIVENSDVVIFNIRPRARTEVIALFQVDMKATPTQYPTFHLFIS